MPVLKDFRQTKKITIPSFPGSEIEIYNSLLVKDVVDLDLSETNPVKLGIDRLPLFIKDWNFTDEKDQKLPISRESLGFLKEDDLRVLVEGITGYVEESKKK